MGGIGGERGQSLDGDGALAEIGLANEGVDEDGVAAAARILRGAEDGVQPLAVRAPHHEAFAPQRFGHRVVICGGGDRDGAVAPAGVTTGPPGTARASPLRRGHRARHRQGDAGPPGTAQHTPGDPGPPSVP